MRNLAALFVVEEALRLRNVRETNNSFQQSIKTCSQSYKNHSDRNCFQMLHMYFVVPQCVSSGDLVNWSSFRLILMSKLDVSTWLILHSI